MSIFSLSQSLTGPPAIRLGFWHSEGSVLPPGYMLTLSNFLHRYLTLALGLFIGWAASRLWRIGCVVLFYWSYTSHPSWEQSQNNVFIVTTKNALDACIDSLTIIKNRSTMYRQLYGKPQRHGRLLGRGITSYRKATYVLLGAVIFAFTSVSLKLAIPLLVALIPVNRLGLVVPRKCGSPPETSTTGEQGGVPYEIRNLRRVNAAFTEIDKPRSANIRSSSPGISRVMIPEQNISLVENSCPLLNASACHSTRSFTFRNQYKLLPQHLGLNIRDTFSLEVHESCYRPYLAVPILGVTDRVSIILSCDSVYHTLCTLQYGPYNTGSGSFQNWTMFISNFRAKAGTYALDAVPALQNSSVGWLPNSNITQGGDTTLLVYYIDVSTRGQNTDPIFASTGYATESPVVPIICDTKYVFCVRNGDRDSCSQPGGMKKLLPWLQDKRGIPWDETYELLSEIVKFPPIYQAAGSASAVLAAQSVSSNVQWSNDISALKELGRLSMAGMLMAASSAQLSANGYMSAFTSNPNISKSFCNHVVMESSAIVTIPVLPYALFTGFSILIIVISYICSFRFPRTLLFSSLRRHYDTWTLHLPGQLHKGLTEGLYGKDFKLVDVESPWPNAPFASGPVIITRNGVKRFGPGKLGMLRETSDSNQGYLLLEPFEPSEYSNEL